MNPRTCDNFSRENSCWLVQKQSLGNETVVNGFSNITRTASVNNHPEPFCRAVEFFLLAIFPSYTKSYDCKSKMPKMRKGSAKKAGVGNSQDRNENVGLQSVNATAGSSADAVVARSDAVRSNMECPVCLQLASCKMLCRCPNKHAVCEKCLARLINENGEGRCPMCRAPFVDTPLTREVTADLARAAATTMVACAHRRYGCTELFAVRDVTAHEESQCRYNPNIRCQVLSCQWLGTYHDLFEHVSLAHPSFVCDYLQVNIRGSVPLTPIFIHYRNGCTKII